VKLDLSLIAATRTRFFLPASEIAAILADAVAT
jgi:hypothetical protein